MELALTAIATTLALAAVALVTRALHRSGRIKEEKLARLLRNVTWSGLLFAVAEVAGKAASDTHGPWNLLFAAAAGLACLYFAYRSIVLAVEYSVERCGRWLRATSNPVAIRVRERLDRNRQMLENLRGLAIALLLLCLLGLFLLVIATHTASLEGPT